MGPYLALALAIAAEVVATSALKATHTFTKLVPSIIAVVGYAMAFYFLSVAVKAIPVGVAHGIWSGVGTVLVSRIAFYLYEQKLTSFQCTGLLFIAAGVFLVNVNI
jgi:small multidrug resistance pump